MFSLSLYIYIYIYIFIILLHVRKLRPDCRRFVLRPGPWSASGEFRDQPLDVLGREDLIRFAVPLCLLSIIIIIIHIIISITIIDTLFLYFVFCYRSAPDGPAFACPGWRCPRGENAGPKIRAWNTVEIVQFEISNSMNPYPSVCHAHTNQMRLVIVWLSQSISTRFPTVLRQPLRKPRRRRRVRGGPARQAARGGVVQRLGPPLRELALSLSIYISLSIYVYVYIYIYKHVLYHYMCIYIYIYVIYIYIYIYIL